MDYNNFLDLNRAFFFITQHVAASLVDQKKAGSIVNVTAVAARQAVETITASAYSMAKTGLDTLTRHAAAELAEHGIRVNAVSPGIVETRIFERFIPGEQLDGALVQVSITSIRWAGMVHRAMLRKLLFPAFR
mgnify:CR=1 FL=1